MQLVVSFHQSLDRAMNPFVTSADFAHYGRNTSASGQTVGAIVIQCHQSYNTIYKTTLNIEIQDLPSVISTLSFEVSYSLLQPLFSLNHISRS